MESIDGARLLVRSLRAHGVRTLFSVPGDPMGPFLEHAARAGIDDYTIRHEQAIAMAAQAYSYVSRDVGVGAVTSGPAMTNAITGLATAWANCWPMLLLGGSSELGKRGLGDFQELPQVESAAPYARWSVAVDNPRRIPWFVSEAVKRATHGRPGPVYLDLPADVLTASVPESEVEEHPVAPPAPRPAADPALVERAARALAQAQRPLLLIGKGAAWADAAPEARALVEECGIPFVPSPMGKGVVPDDHPLCAAGARSFALRNADLVILAGARFNWTFHFGRPPRFAEDVRVVQIDIEPSEIGLARPVEAGLVGDVRAVLAQLREAAAGRVERREPWIADLDRERARNAAQIAQLAEASGPRLNLYRMYREINEVAGPDAVVVADGEATMAISRVMQPNVRPRERLDAGTTGCMGVGIPYAIGAQIARPDARVVCAMGDFAAGWNGMDLETAVRYELPILFIVANNGSVRRRPGRALSAEDFGPEDAVRYDHVMPAFGGHAEHVESASELHPALERALAARGPALVHVLIDPQARRKQQAFGWLGREGRTQYGAG